MSNWWDTDVNGWQYFLGKDAVTGIQQPYQVDAAIYMAVQERLFAGGFNFSWSYGNIHYPITDVYAAKDLGAIKRLNRPNIWLDVAYEVSNILPLFYYRDASTFKRIRLVSNDPIENIKHACSIFGIEFKGASRRTLANKRDAKFADTIIKLLNKLVITNVTTWDYDILSPYYGAVKMLYPVTYTQYHYERGKTFAEMVASVRVEYHNESPEHTLFLQPYVFVTHTTDGNGIELYDAGMTVYNPIKLTNRMELPFAVHSRLWSWPYGYMDDDFGTGLDYGEKKDILTTNTVQPGDSVEIFTFADPPVFPDTDPVPELHTSYSRHGDFLLCPLFNFTQGFKFVDPSYQGSLYVPEGSETSLQ